jgi:riboflavin synthase
MFTGIVEELGSIGELEVKATGARIRVNCSTVLSDATTGCSIAVNGVCLTALDLQAGSFAADLAPETLARTSLGALQPGSKVNLERPLLATGRLSGHIVQGHVDGTGEVMRLELLGEGNWWLEVRVPAELLNYCVQKGSICLDGISLTIATLEADRVGVTIIPHTYEATNLREKHPGDAINIECDVIAKYVERMAAVGG